MNHYFMTPTQVAELLQVSEETILELLEAKMMHGVRVGKVWRIRDDQFDGFVKSNATVLPTSEEEEKISTIDDYDEEFVGTRTARRGGTKKNRYTPLADYLKRRTGRTIRLSFDEIEKIIGGPLPQSARDHRAWWANDKFHSQGKAWMGAGWFAEGLDLQGQTIAFSREG